jgi:hypothetical protein
MPKQEQRVKVVCFADGFEDLWIEYDVSKWGGGVYADLHGQITIPQVVTEFIPEYSTDWHIKTADGTVVAHPGRKASKETWLNVWHQIEPETFRAIYPWIWMSTLTALQESLALPPKSAVDDQDDGTGEKDA